MADEKKVHMESFKLEESYVIPNINEDVVVEEKASRGDVIQKLVDQYKAAEDAVLSNCCKMHKNIDILKYCFYCESLIC